MKKFTLTIVTLLILSVALNSCGSSKLQGKRCSKYNKKHWNNNFTRGWNSY